MKPKNTLWTIEPHTLAKHQILQTYLQAWLPIMSKYNSRLVYIDGFAGPGVYTGGEPGSPIIALNAFLKHAHRHLIKAELVYAFIEERADRCERLRAEIAGLGKLPNNVKVAVNRGAYEEVFTQLLDELKGSSLAPTFAFIDPFGYSKASMELSGRFLQFARCEVLIYVPLKHVNRFIGREGQDNALTSLFGTERWRQAIDLTGVARLSFLHDLFRDQLKSECNLKYVRSFEIVTSAPNSGYHLFFGTDHVRGLEKMKDAMWKVDPVQGVSYRDSTASEEDQGVLFGKNPDTRALVKMLREHFRDREFSIDEAEMFTLEATAYRKAHLRTLTLKRLEEQGKIQLVKKPEKRRKGDFKGTTMRFVKP